MCDKCRQLEIQNKGLSMIINDLRFILEAKPGDSIIELVKDLIKDAKVEEPEEECTKVRKFGRYAPISADDKKKISDMMTKYGLSIDKREAYKDRLRRLANSGLEDTMESDEYEFILRMRKKLPSAR